MTKPEDAAAFVYALCEPCGDPIRYIGTTVDVWRRLHDHYSRSHSSLVRKWVSGLRQKGMAPCMKVLCVCESIDEAVEAERIEIRRHYDAGGGNLLNDTHTGRDRPISAGSYGLLEFGGERMRVSEWAKRLGISRQALYARLNEYPTDVALGVAAQRGVKLEGQQVKRVAGTHYTSASTYSGALTHAERRHRRKVIADRVRAGATIDEAAKVFCVTAATVYAAVKEFSGQ